MLREIEIPLVAGKAMQQDHGRMWACASGDVHERIEHRPMAWNSKRLHGRASALLANGAYRLLRIGIAKRAKGAQSGDCAPLSQVPLRIRHAIQAAGGNSDCVRDSASRLARGLL